MLSLIYFSARFTIWLPEGVRVKNFTAINARELSVICKDMGNGFLEFCYIVSDKMNTYIGDCLGGLTVPVSSSVEKTAKILKKYILDNLLVGDKSAEPSMQVKLCYDFKVNRNYPFSMIFHIECYMLTQEKFILQILLKLDDTLKQNLDQSYVIQKHLTFDHLENYVKAIAENILINRVSVEDIRPEDDKNDEK